MTIICGILAAFTWPQPAVRAENAEPFFESRQVFTGIRFPNVVVTTEGTVLAFAGHNSPLKVRRSEDGGETWGEVIEFGEPRSMMGAAVVDEASGDIIVFNHFLQHQGAYRSSDDGRTWREQDITIKPDLNGSIGVTHGSDSGITLRHGEHAGRLLIASRSFGPEHSNDVPWWPYHYTNAIYSDDGGATWQTSDPFPVMGTGESTIAELSNGTIYYNTRSHTATDARRRAGWSHDGGMTWVNPYREDVLPDGPLDNPYGLMGGLTRVPHDEREILVFSNADTPGSPEGPGGRTGGRENITVWVSLDGAQSWPIKRSVDAGPGAYSSMTIGREGTPSEGLIYLQYESGPHGAHDGSRVARFNLAWLLAEESETAR